MSEPRCLPAQIPDGAEEMALHYWSPFDVEEGFCIRMYERALRLQGWAPLEGTAHVHNTPPVVSVHGLATRTERRAKAREFCELPACGCNRRTP